MGRLARTRALGLGCLMSGVSAGLLAFAIAFGIYLMTLCPTVYVEGSGELIGAVLGLGTPHPTGYPLFCLSGRLIAHLLPFAGTAYKVNMTSAFFAAATCGLLTWLLCWRGVQVWVGLAAGLAFAFSSTFWSQAVIAEVYGQALLMVVVVFASGLRAVENKDSRSLLLLGWLMGLGLTTHLMQVLLWPGLLALVFWRWPALAKQPLTCLQILLAGLGGYSLVAYLALRNGLGGGFHWDPIPDAYALWQHITGAQYRSSFFSLPLEGMLLNAWRWLEQIRGEFHPLLLPLVFWGAYVTWRRDRNLWVLTGGALGCNLIAALNYHRDPNGLPVFYLLSLLCLALWFGLGLDDLARRLDRGKRAWLLVVMCAIVVGGVLSSHYAESDRSQNWVADRYGRDILADLPADAVLIAEGDDAAFVLDYLQRIEEVRPDVTLYNRAGRGMDLLTREEHALPPRDRDRLRQRREQQLARSGRPLYYLVPRRTPIKGWEFVPAGLVYRLQPPERDRPYKAEQIEMANAMAEGFFRDAWVRKIQSNYWFMAAEQLQKSGDQSGAIAAYEQAGTMAFDSRSTRFNVALKLYKNNILDRASTHAEAAVDIDPWKADPYRLLAHIRRNQGREDEARILLKKADELRLAP